MRTLLVTQALPLPANTGGRQRTLAMVRRLSGVSEVTLAALDEGDTDWTGLRRLGITVRSARRPNRLGAQLRGVARVQSAAGRYWSHDLAAQLQREARARPVDLLVVGYSHMTPYRHLVDASCKVLDLHNVESSLLSSLVRSRGLLRGLPARLEAPAMRRLERRVLGDFDIVTVVSEIDRARLPERLDDVLVCPNGTDPAPALPAARNPIAAFVGLMCWRPNIDAAVWLARDIWPLVSRRVPGARLLLVGTDPVRRVRSLAGPTVEVTGTVADVGPYLAAARIALAPLLAGGGSRLKVLEALGRGRPVVATSLGVEGLEDLVGRGVLVADSTEEMAATISELLLDGPRCHELGQRGRGWVRARYSWDSTLRPLLEAIAPGRPRSAG